MDRYPDCPRQWYGPDDWSEGEDPQSEIIKRNHEIWLWEQTFNDLPWHKRWYIILFTDTRTNDA